MCTSILKTFLHSFNYMYESIRCLIVEKNQTFSVQIGTVHLKCSKNKGTAMLFS